MRAMPKTNMKMVSSQVHTGDCCFIDTKIFENRLCKFALGQQRNAAILAADVLRVELRSMNGG